MNKEVDLNARIVNLEYIVEARDGIPYCVIGFKNLYYGTIKAIRFNAEGFNYFSESILVDGKKNFKLMIQDLNVSEGESISGIKVGLPDSNIRIVELKLEQICYNDKKVVTASDSDYVQYSLDLLDANQDKIQLEILKKANAQSICYAKKQETGWICSCGYYNKIDVDRCVYCGSEKKFILSKCSFNGISKCVQDEIKEKKKERRLLLLVLLGIAVLIGSIYLFIYINDANAAKREIEQNYENAEKEMDMGGYTEALSYLQSIPDSFRSTRDLKKICENRIKEEANNNYLLYEYLNDIDPEDISSSKEKVLSLPNEFLTAHNITSENVDTLCRLLCNTWLCFDEESKWMYIMSFEFNQDGTLVCIEKEYGLDKKDIFWDTYLEDRKNRHPRNTYTNTVDYETLLVESNVYVGCDDKDDFSINIKELDQNTIVEEFEDFSINYYNCTKTVKNISDRDMNNGRKDTYFFLTSIAQFPEEEAEYAIANAGIDWFDKATKYIESSAEFSIEYGFGNSPKSLEDDLVKYGYTVEEIEYAFKNAKVDWNELCLSCARSMERESIYNNKYKNKNDIYNQLLSNECGFSEREADYAIERL